jgi:hypothetical protein
LAILSQTIARGGGQALITSIRDLTESGTATFNFDGELRASMTVKSKGLRQIRIDADLPEGRRSTVVNGSGGLLKEANGQFRAINEQSADDLRDITFPYLPIMAALQDFSTNITFMGLVMHSGAPAYELRIEKAHAPGHASRRQRASHPRDFYVDPKTFLVMAISDQIRNQDDPRDGGVPHEVLYSNYQAQNGIAMPMTIREQVRGAAGISMELSQVTFNSGLTDSDFSEQ